MGPPSWLVRKQSSARRAFIATCARHACRNRKWTAQEFEITWHHAQAPLKRALAMASFTGMRIGDIVSVTWTSWDGEALS